MKICIIAPVLSGKGGTETVVTKVINSIFLDHQGLKVSLYLAGGTYNSEWLNALKNTIIYNITSKSKIIKLLKLIKFLVTSNDDALLILSTKLIYIAAIVKKIFHKKYKIVSWIHFSLFDEAQVNIKQLRYADSHFAISSGIKKQLKSVGVNDELVHIIFNPVTKNSSTIRFPKNNSAEFMYVGRILFDGQKNIHELIDFMAKQETTSWKLHLFGTGPDEEKCKKYILNNYPEKQNCFIWHGWDRNPWKKIETVNALILTSKFEGFPMVLLEAMSRGIPCISSNCPTGPADIINSKNGQLYETGNFEDFSQKMKLLMSTEYDSKKIKMSIDKFYDANYEYNFLKSLEEVVKK